MKQNRCSHKFRKVHRKAPVLESLFNNLQVFNLELFLEKDSDTGAFFVEFYRCNCCFHIDPLSPLSQFVVSIKPEFSHIYSQVSYDDFAEIKFILLLCKQV